jgi:UDP-3-O-[3-hydroxymyristoyl] glucosamine N-acyltransferase
MNQPTNPRFHPNADVQSSAIGAGTDIWQYVVVLPQAIVGQGSNICAQVFIENEVVVGDRVTIKSGVQLWDGLRIADDVFIGPNVTFTNDKFPRSKQYPEQYLVTHVKRGASIGGGGSSAARHHDWRAGNGGRRCGGDPFSTGCRHCDWQPGTGGRVRGVWR